MDAMKAVKRRLKKLKPVKKYLKRRRARAARREEQSRIAEAKKLEAQLYEICDLGPYFETLSKRDLKRFLEGVKILEDRLAELDKRRSLQYKRYVKAHYLKELSPKLYERWSAEPVQDKVLFMEKDGGRTQPNGLLYDTIKAQGRYKPVMIGLGRGKNPQLGIYENALRAIKVSATSKAVFISSGNSVFSQFDMRPETKLIQLWHGLGVFKKVGYSTLQSGKFGMSAAARAEYPQYRNYSYVTLPSAEQAWVFEDAMRIPADSGVFAPIGVSRTDIFFDDDLKARTLARLHEAFPAMEGKKIIFYAPTYRGRVSNAKAPDKLDVAMMAEALSDDYVLLIKHHGFSKKVPPIPEPYRDTFAFDMAKRGFSTDALLHVSDICITDYSSIGFEFSILERPIVFFAYDLEDYIDKRGMYYDYEDITPGPVCRTNEEMIDYIAHIDERFDKAEISAFRKKYVGACDGHSTERTIALIER